MGRLGISLLMLLFFMSAIPAADVVFTIKDIVVYPQQVALITKEANLGRGNAFSTIVEPNVFPKSVRITEENAKVTGIRINKEQKVAAVKNIIAPLNVRAVLAQNQNKKLQLFTDKGLINGKLIYLGDEVAVLSNVNYKFAFAGALLNESVPFMSIQMGAIQNVMLTEKPDLPDGTKNNAELAAMDAGGIIQPPNYYPSNTNNLELAWKDTGKAPRKATLSYLTKGISWEPVYFLDIENDKQARFMFWAKIANTASWNVTNASMKLVAGSIKLSTYGSDSSYLLDSVSQRAIGGSYPGEEYNGMLQPSISALEEYELYALPGPFSLKAQETNLVPIFEDAVTFQKDLIYDARLENSRSWYNYNSWEQEAEGKVQNVYRIKNGGRTWPVGIVSAYQDGMLIGEDSIEWTPNGKEAKVTVGIAADIEAKRKETVKRFYNEDKKHQDYDYNHKVVITLKNFKKEKTAVKVLDTFASEALNMAATVPYEERPGNLMEWNLNLAPGETKEISYTFMTE
ncbi:MAG: DUF4139 domain-containing protein [Candidatus Micrarchaeota archaeon]